MPIASQRQFLVRLSGEEGYFATRTGGETTADANREFDGGATQPEVLTGPAITGDVVLGRAYKPERDGDLLRRMRPQVGRLRTSWSYQPTDRDLAPTGRPTVYTGVLIGVNDPEADANSGDASRIELTFAVETVV